LTENSFRDFIEQVRDQADIVQIVGQYLELSNSFKAHCPFHDDRSPSFSVHPKGQYYYCFGCGKGGDVFDFVMEIEGLGFREALFNLAQANGITPPEIAPEQIQEIKKVNRTQEILRETALFYKQHLSAQARDYLKNDRGFNDEAISKFQIGYACKGLQQYLLDGKKFNIEDCIEAGVLKRSGNSSVQSHFRNRIVFPNIYKGKIVHMTGRSIDGREPKYLHLPGPISRLYNEASLYGREVIITEGVTDCLSAVQAGYGAVGLYGVQGLKVEHIPKFSHCKRVYVCMDADKAGESGALKVAEALGDKSRIIQLPDGYDLNEYFLRHTPDDFEKLKKKAKDLIRYKLGRIPPDVDKVELSEHLKPILLDLSKSDTATVEAYLSHEIKPRFGLKNNDVDAYRRMIKNEIEKQKPKSSRPSSKSDNTKYTAHFDGLIDLVSDGNEVAFLVGNGDGIAIQHEIEIDGEIFSPPLKSQIPWLLPRAEKVLELFELEDGLPANESDGALYDDLKDYHKRISELPSEEYYDLITAWDFHTYLQEKLQYSPIICFFAVPERGKTRTGKGIINLAYRGIHVESLREAYIFRVANDLRVSLFFDVKDIWRKAEKNGSEDILLQRFEKGSTVPRVIYPDRGALRDTVYYRIFGPTIIGTNEPVHRILGTRAIQINMPETCSQFESDVTPESALELKERLVCFRARHMGQELPEAPKPARGRLGDILKPIFQIVKLVQPERESALSSLVQQLEDDRKLEKSESIEALILGGVLALAHKIENGLLAQKEIVSHINEDRPEKRKFTPQLIGKRLVALGIKKAKLSDGTSAIIWNASQLEQIAEKYGLSNSSVTAVTSVSSVKSTEETDHTEDTEVSSNVYRENFL